MLKLAYRAASAANTRLDLPGHGHILPHIISEDMLQNILDQNHAPHGLGRFVQGIPGTQPDDDVRAITILNLKTGKCITAGTRDADHKLIKYSQQSMSKPVAEVLALKLIGPKKFAKQVGFNASGRAYNEKVTYGDRPGIPFNSNVNIGALKVWDILTTEARIRGQKPIDMYMDFLKKLANNDGLEINKDMADGQYRFQPDDGTPSNNRQLLQVLKSHGNLENSLDEVYESYCQACAVMIDTEDSARIRSKFNDGTDPRTGEKLIPYALAQQSSRSMTVSGMYDESGTTYAQYNMSGKSGVDGGLMLSLPSKIPGNPDLIIATHHAGLNPRGNSHEGLKWVKDLQQRVLIFPDDAKLLNTKAVVKGTYNQIRDRFRQGDVKGQLRDSLRSELPSRRERHQILADAMTDGGHERLVAAIQQKADAKVARMVEDLTHNLEENTKDKSPEDTARMSSENEAAIAASTKLLAYKGGYYLKPARRDWDGLDESSLLMREADRNGKMKSYHFVKDTHFIEKIVVFEDSTPTERNASS